MSGILVNKDIPSTDVLTGSTVIRFVTFVSIGALIGMFASRNRAMLNELRILAERDVLTGLPNTRAFEAAITKRLETGRPFGLLLADTDALKELNREAGPSAGNEALRQVADRLSRSLAAEDQIARVGSDEFAVLASTATLDEASELSARLEWVLSSQGRRRRSGGRSIRRRARMRSRSIAPRASGSTRARSCAATSAWRLLPRKPHPV